MGDVRIVLCVDVRIVLLRTPIPRVFQVIDGD